MPPTNLPNPIPAHAFWARVRVGDKAGDCWSWIGSVNASGYGIIWQTRGSWRAHRLSWTLRFGEIPDGLFVCHKCDNPPCTNPDHLFLGTNTDNMRDCARKGRLRNPIMIGDDHPRARLTSQKVREIKSRLAAGDSQLPIAKDYGIAQQTVANISCGHTWRHVTITGENHE